MRNSESFSPHPNSDHENDEQQGTHNSAGARGDQLFTDLRVSLINEVRRDPTTTQPGSVFRVQWTHSVPFSNLTVFPEECLVSWVGGCFRARVRGAIAGSIVSCTASAPVEVLISTYPRSSRGGKRRGRPECARRRNRCRPALRKIDAREMIFTFRPSSASAFRVLGFFPFWGGSWALNYENLTEK